MTEADDRPSEDGIIHVGIVREARRELPAPQTVLQLIDLFSALGDPTRLRIVSTLAARELCVCDLAAAIGKSRSTVSQQLRLLCNLGLVRSRRDQQRVFYSLDDEHVATLYAQAMDHVEHREKRAQ